MRTSTQSICCETCKGHITCIVSDPTRSDTSDESNITGLANPSATRHLKIYSWVVLRSKFNKMGTAQSFCLVVLRGSIICSRHWNVSEFWDYLNISSYSRLFAFIVHCALFIAFCFSKTICDPTWYIIPPIEALEPALIFSNFNTCVQTLLIHINFERFELILW